MAKKKLKITKEEVSDQEQSSLVITETSNELTKLEQDICYKLDNEKLYNSKLLNKREYRYFITMPHSTFNTKELHEALWNSSPPPIFIRTVLEPHKPKENILFGSNNHQHIALFYKNQVKVSTIHNIIKGLSGECVGTIDYEKLKGAQGVNYIRKPETLEEYQDGEMPKTVKTQVKRDENGVKEAMDLSRKGNIDDAIKLLWEKQPANMLKYADKYLANLKTLDKVRDKWDLPENKIDTEGPKPWQKQVIDLVKKMPKKRQIIWVWGSPDQGKSTLFEWLGEVKNNPKGFFCAGTSLSMDNLAHHYDEEGIIAWDFPLSYEFEDKLDILSTIIEIFSDFGKPITSKKYNGKTQYVRGHCVVFSNSPPIRTLKHKNIIEIQTDELVKKPANKKSIKKSCINLLENLSDIESDED